METLEADFLRLINVLSIQPDALDEVLKYAQQAQLDNFDPTDEQKLEEKKKAEIAKHQRAIKNNLTLFKNGEIDEEEYYREKDFHERQIAYWMAQTSDVQRIRVDFSACAHVLSRIQQFWEISEGEDRRMLAQNLFDEIVYDLDAERIVDFTVKAWAERFLVMRAALYEDALGEEMKNRFNSGSSRAVPFDDPIGLSGRKLLHLRRLAETVLKFVNLLYPASFLSTIERNQLIQARHAEGIGLSALAEQFGISPQRVYQIVHGKHH